MGTVFYVNQTTRQIDKSSRALVPKKKKKKGGLNGRINENIKLRYDETVQSHRSSRVFGWFLVFSLGEHFWWIRSSEVPTY